MYRPTQTQTPHIEMVKSSISFLLQEQKLSSESRGRCSLINSQHNKVVFVCIRAALWVLVKKDLMFMV